MINRGHQTLVYIVKNVMLGSEVPAEWLAGGDTHILWMLFFIVQMQNYTFKNTMNSPGRVVLIFSTSRGEVN